MSSRVAVLFNSPYLGGAERSMIAQAKMMGDEISYFVPEVRGHSVADLGRALSEYTLLPYPKSLYEVSRRKGIANIFKIFSLLILIIKLWREGIKSYDVLWCNGNKIAFPIFLYCVLFGYRGKLVWHFRDYPASNKGWSLTWLLLKLPRRFKLFLVGNSKSVSESLRKLSSDKVFTLYNPVGLSLPNREVKEIKSLGVVSMMAPWKGIHQVLLWANLFESELISLGIKRIKIFGGDIYATSGGHQGYLDQLYELNRKLPSSLIEFCGNCSPFQIYSEIDLLIHPVVEPEPFGRIISEAYYSGIVVLSTQLGGSSELVAGDPISLYDYAGLTQRIRNLIDDPGQYQRLLGKGRDRLMKIEGSIEKGIEAILNYG